MYQEYFAELNPPRPYVWIGENDADAHVKDWKRIQDQRRFEIMARFCFPRDFDPEPYMYFGRGGKCT